jgi:hypothetical protein
MRVSIDPDTGEYTDARLDAPEAAAMMAPAAPLVERALPDGGVAMRVDHLRHAFVATVGPDGDPTVRCIDVPQAPGN